MAGLITRARRKLKRYRDRKIVDARLAPKLVPQFATFFPDAYFVQVGSNDGVHADPLRLALQQHPMSGLLIEPVPYVFQRLLENSRQYGGRVQPVNVAIADRQGSLPFWHLREAGKNEEKLPKLYDSLGSFRKDVILSHKWAIPDIEERLVSTHVASLPLKQLFEDFTVPRLDFFQVDTEGYDFEVLRQLDFSAYRPRLVIYEHLHLDADTRRAAENLFRNQGYRLAADDMDTHCFDVCNTEPAHQRWLKASQRFA